MIEPSEILFIGHGKSAVTWYRAMLPAMNMGADWIGVVGEPPKPAIATGLVRQQTALPNYDDYKVVIISQPKGLRWMGMIRELRARGIKVLFEVDDYLHGVRKQKQHDFSKRFDKQALREYELCMRACDGIIASTDYIAKRYRSFNANVFIVRNAIDPARYRLTRPERETVNIGWAGATGHGIPLLEWVNQAVIPIMTARPETCFISVGNPGLGDSLHQMFPRRSIGIPWTFIENYPAAMSMFDIALAPAGKTAWYLGKSDLRWLEAAALGIPTVADPTLYPEIEDGETGFQVDDADEAREVLRHLVGDPELRARVGEAAREHVLENRSFPDAALRWLEVCRAVAGEYESVAQAT